MFCALLEFALVNYASRSDMQRERARERIDRARRQWELEHGDMEGVVENEKTGIRKGANCSQMMPPYDAAVLTMQNGTTSTKAIPRAAARSSYRPSTSYPHPTPYNPHQNTGASLRLERERRDCEMHGNGGSSSFYYNLLFGCCRSKSILSRFSSRAKRIDVISRFIFPLLFAIFNLAYWLYYLLAKGSNETYKNEAD